MRSSVRPQGGYASRGSGVKLRCINLNDVQNYWDSFWNTGLFGTAGGSGWASDGSNATLLTMLNYFGSVGFNSVKIYFDGMTSGNAGGNGPGYGAGYPATAPMKLRVAWFCAQCRRLGFKVYLATNQSIDFVGSAQAVTNANIATNVSYLKLFMSYGPDLVAAVDCCNEANGSGRGNYWGNPSAYQAQIDSAGNAARDLGLLVRAIQTAFPGLPVSFSFFNNSKGNLSGANPWLDLQYQLGCAFHDTHNYYDFGTTTVEPAGSDAAALAARSKYLGSQIIGECGVGPAANPGYVNYPQAAGRATYRPAWLAGMGDCTRHADSIGAVWFCATPYYQNYTTSGGLSYQYGILDPNLSNTYASDVVAGVQGWLAS